MGERKRRGIVAPAGLFTFTDGRHPVIPNESLPPLYKVLDADGRPSHGGNGEWSLPTRDDEGGWTPGEWREEPGELTMCFNGLHLCEFYVLDQWMQQKGSRVFLAEVDGPAQYEVDQKSSSTHATGKWMTGRVRLVEELPLDFRAVNYLRYRPDPRRRHQSGTREEAVRRMGTDERPAMEARREIQREYNRIAHERMIRREYRGADRAFLLAALDAKDPHAYRVMAKAAVQKERGIYSEAKAKAYLEDVPFVDKRKKQRAAARRRYEGLSRWFVSDFELTAKEREEMDRRLREVDGLAKGGEEGNALLADMLERLASVPSIIDPAKRAWDEEFAALIG